MSVAPMDTCMSYGVMMVRRTKTEGWVVGGSDGETQSLNRIMERVCLALDNPPSCFFHSVT